MPDWCKNLASSATKAALSHSKTGQSGCYQFHCTSYSRIIYHSWYIVL